MNFNLTAYELALVAGGFTLAGALIGIWADHLLTDIRNKKERLITQYTAFKDSFIPTVQIINKTPRTPEDFQLFPTHFENQERIMYAFRGNLKGDTLSSFDQKWKEYKEWQKSCNESYEICVVTVGTHGHEIIALINELLYIAGRKV